MARIDARCICSRPKKLIFRPAGAQRRSIQGLCLFTAVTGFKRCRRNQLGLYTAVVRRGTARRRYAGCSADFRRTSGPRCCCRGALALFELLYDKRWSGMSCPEALFAFGYTALPAASQQLCATQGDLYPASLLAACPPLPSRSHTQHCRICAATEPANPVARCIGFWLPPARH